MKEELEVALRALKWAMSRSRQREERDYYYHAVKSLEALVQPEQKPATYSSWGLMGGDDFVNRDSLKRNIT